MMLQIRAKQMEVFERAAAESFEEELISHFRRFSPRHSEVIETAGVRRTVRLGLKRARKYGLTCRGPVQFYIEMMYMFGSDFDTDPQIPWAGGMLEMATDAGQVERADRLYDKTTAYLARVSGPDGEYSLEALRRLSRALCEDRLTPAADSEDVMIGELRIIYPQKCEYLGVESMRALVRRGLASAREYSVASARGRALFVALTFALGHGFAADPLYPWVSAILNDSPVGDADGRAERLHSGVKLYFEQSLTYQERLGAHV